MYQEGCDDDVMSCLKNKEIYVAVVIDVVLVELTATETHVCMPSHTYGQQGRSHTLDWTA
jgi:hypothetical protein